MVETGIYGNFLATSSRLKIMINQWNSWASKCRNCKDNGLNGSPIVLVYPATGKATPASLFPGGPVRLPRVNSNGGELPPRHCNELLAAFLEHLGQVPAGVWG